MAKEPVFTNPVIVPQTNGDLSENQNFPNLLLSDNGYIMHYQIESNDNRNINSIHLQTEPQFITIDEYLMFDSTVHPFRPFIKSIDSKNILFWYEITTNNDTLYRQQLMTFSGLTPQQSEFDNRIKFNQIDTAVLYSPQFKRSGDRLYCQIFRRDLSDPDNNKVEFSLRSLDWESSDLYPTNLHFSANGKTALSSFGDSLLLVKSWIYCIRHENMECSEWASGYKAYIIFENRIQDIHALESFNVHDEADQPADIESAKFYNESVFILMQSKKIMRINRETNTFQQLFDLNSYAVGEYERIIPIQTINNNIVLLQHKDITQSSLLRFDYSWRFIDSTSLRFDGDVKEVSDFVYYPQKDMLAYAYSTQLYPEITTDRIMLQAVLFDEDLFSPNGDELPETFILSQNYPNPFNPLTKFEYSIPSQGDVLVDVFNIAGQKVTTLYNGNETAGVHEVEWDASGQSSGIYLIKVSYGEQTKSIKTMLLK